MQQKQANCNSAKYKENFARFFAFFSKVFFVSQFIWKFMRGYFGLLFDYCYLLQSGIYWVLYLQCFQYFLETETNYFDCSAHYFGLYIFGLFVCIAYFG